MRFTVELSLKRTERSFERAVSLAGRRGYEIVAVAADLSEDGQSLRVRLTLESERRAESLLHQLEKLFEVEAVRLAS